MTSIKSIIDTITSAPAEVIDKNMLLRQYPEPVVKYFRYHLPDGFPSHTFAKTPMKGIIKLVNWANFKSVLYSHPFIGFLWQARVMMGILPVNGYDYFFKNQGAMSWKMFKLIPVMSASDENVTRSAEGRAIMESLFAPHLLIHPDINWEAVSEEEITATWTIFREKEPLHLIIGKDGSLKSAFINRWGNPGGVKKFNYSTFGVHIEKQFKYKGTMIPAKGNAGWWFGTEKYKDGEFFRFEVI
ncbi:MAG TPA: hypothetical protein PLI65_04705 [Bacteroidales bacterium]|nr:hypothetical protein [Bacteroidales bacterium]HPR57839.1 hypothetical protein [Bacteroidales bacterium]